MAERESDKVCLLLEKSRSTEMLTPGMARISRAMRARMGKSTACICREKLISIDNENMPNRKYSPSTTWGHYHQGMGTCRWRRPRFPLWQPFVDRVWDYESHPKIRMLMLAVPREQLYLMLKSPLHKRHINVRGAREHVLLWMGPILMCPRNRGRELLDKYVELLQQVFHALFLFLNWRWWGGHDRVRSVEFRVSKILNHAIWIFKICRLLIHNGSPISNKLLRQC